VKMSSRVKTRFPVPVFRLITIFIAVTSISYSYCGIDITDFRGTECVVQICLHEGG